MTERSVVARLLMLGAIGTSLVVIAELAAAPWQEGSAQTVRQQEAGSGLRIQLLQGGERAKMQRFAVEGLPVSELRRRADAAGSQPDVWLDTMIVTVASDADTKARPMLGEYSIAGHQLVFTPRFPLRPGTTYRVEVFTSKDRARPAIADEFEIPSLPASAPTRLVAVFPTTNILPENQLKFYLHFSAPMSRGEAYRRVQLLDQDGQPVEFPFLELGEELWDPSGTRFTLFFDPGRIKRGLQPRELFGPALEAGNSYTLVIDRQWKDARGNPLAESHRKEFKVVEPDETQPEIQRWVVVPPAAQTRKPLVIAFGEPLDHAMLQRVLTVKHDGGAAVPGRIVISKHESQWTFQPEADWAAGTYSLVVDAALEDLAGNSLGRPFEVDVFEKVDRRPPQTTVRIPFEIQRQ